jgi:Phage major capsid protein E
MPAPYYSPIPQTTPYEYVGEPPALGSLSLTRLARSYAELDTTDLSDLFPDQHNPERTIVIETVQESLGLMPLARPGVPVGNFTPNKRMFRRIVEPALFREDDFIDQYLINQLRKPGTLNEVSSPQMIIEDRIRDLTNRHNRTLDFFRIQCLLGGINYDDPRTGVSIDVPTQIPAHNFFSYKGFNSTLNAGASITLGGVPWVAETNLINDKNRTEAVLFSSADQRIGVPWTHPRADLVRCLRILKQFGKNTNKNLFTDIFMSGDLYTIIQENNLIKAEMGSVGYFNFNVNNTDKGLTTASSNANSSRFISFGPGGDITAIAGLRINVVDQVYKDPVDGEVRNMWPSNKVVLVARNHVNDPSQTLGYTQYCVGEAPDNTSGLWIRTGPEQSPPMTPGRTIQMGNSFLPYATYPQWIAVLDVCEASDIDDKSLIRSNLKYGTF